MIQRIQSVWLFLAALVSAGLFYFNLHQADVMKDGAMVTEKLGASNHVLLMFFTVALITLPLVAIFLFKDRKKQKRLALLAIIAHIGFIAAAVMLIGNINNSTPPPVDSTYLPIGMVLPVIAIVLIILAIRGINKDDRLIRSQDRLR